MTDLAAVGDTYIGVYTFDNLTVRNKATVITADDMFVNGVLDVTDAVLCSNNIKLPDALACPENLLGLSSGEPLNKQTDHFLAAGNEYGHLETLLKLADASFAPVSNEKVLEPALYSHEPENPVVAMANKSNSELINEKNIQNEAILATALLTPPVEDLIGIEETKIATTNEPFTRTNTEALNPPAQKPDLQTTLPASVINANDPEDLPQPETKDTSTDSLLLASLASDTEDKNICVADPIYSYDSNENRTSMIDPTGITLYNYNELNQFTSITNPAGHTIIFDEYDAVGRRKIMSFPNGVVTTYDYDAAGRLVSLVHQKDSTVIASFTYQYDKVGNRVSMTDIYGIHTYGFDKTYQLKTATHPQSYNPAEAYDYDPVGNRKTSHVAPGFENDYNEANRLLEDAFFTYEYDNEGNLIKKTDKGTTEETTYAYDAENTLIHIDFPDGSFVEYRYDGKGRRFEKNVNGVKTRYFYDQEDILLEYDENDNLIARYTHRPGIDEPLIMERDMDNDGTLESAFFYHADGLGSIVALTDLSGNVVQTYEYDSFGNIVRQTGTIPNPYTYTAREYDEESGLYYYRARYYDAKTGRFLQEDPIGFDGGDVNLYRYVRNGVISSTDPLGLGLTRAEESRRWDKMCLTTYDRCMEGCADLACIGSLLTAEVTIIGAMLGSVFPGYGTAIGGASGSIVTGGVMQWIIADCQTECRENYAVCLKVNPFR